MTDFETGVRQLLALNDLPHSDGRMAAKAFAQLIMEMARKLDEFSVRIEQIERSLERGV